MSISISVVSVASNYNNNVNMGFFFSNLEPAVLRSAYLVYAAVHDAILHGLVDFHIHGT